MSERIDYLAIGVAAALHLFNPQTLFLHGRFVRECPEVLERLRKRLVTRTLPPALADCCIVLAQGSKAQGVVAGMIEYLIDSRLPKEILAIAPKL